MDFKRLAATLSPVVAGLIVTYVLTGADPTVVEGAVSVLLTAVAGYLTARWAPSKKAPSPKA